MADERGEDGTATKKAVVADGLDNSKGTTRRIADAYEGKGIHEGTGGGKKAAAKEGLKEGAAHAAEKGLGVPKQATRTVLGLADKMPPWMKKVAVLGPAGMLLLPMIIAMVVAIGVIGSLLISGSDPAQGMEPIENIGDYLPEETMNAIQEAASKADVPWTVLASVTVLGTEAGKFSPYPSDLVDRDLSRKGIRRPNAGEAGTATSTGPPAPMTAGAPGTTRKAFAEAMAHGIGAPNEAAVRFLVAWTAHEGMGADYNNPMATSLAMSGAEAINSHGVKRYPSGQVGLEAGVKTLTGGSGRYTRAVEALRAGNLTGVEDMLMAGGYCSGACPPYTQHQISAAAASYATDPAKYEQAGSKQVVTTPVGAASGATTAGGPVTVIGDSLCEPGAAGDALSSALSAAVFTPTLNCVRNRALQGEGQALVTDAVAKGGTVVVALGTNDAVGGNAAGFTAAMDAALANSKASRIVWVNTGTTLPGGAAINSAIAAAVGKYPSMVVADWSSKVTANPALLGADGVHLAGADGYAQRAATIVAALNGSSVGTSVGVMNYPPNPDGLKVEVFPEVTPPIGSDQDPGLGPYLIARRAVEDDDDLDPQLMEAGSGSATTFVAEQLAAAADEMREQGWEEGDEAATDAFWAEAVRRIAVMDPRNAKGCPSPAITATAADPSSLRNQVATAVGDQWRCYIDTAPKFKVLLTEKKRAGTQEASATVVAEALDVAWAFSQWGTAACDDTATLAGVFPLTKEVFEANAPEQQKTAGRCNPAANIAAAAAAFISGEGVEPGERSGAARSVGDRSSDTGRFNPMIGGWWAMPWALGDEASLQSFLDGGRGSTSAIDDTCRARIDNAFVDGTTLENIGADANAAAALGAQIATAAECSAAPPEAVATALAEAAAGKASELRDLDQLVIGGLDDVPDPSTTTTTTAPVRVLERADLDRIAAALDAAVTGFESQGAAVFTAGTDSAVQRLSASGRKVLGEPPVPVSNNPAVDDWAGTVVKLAVALGGTYEDDERATEGGTDPSQIIRTFWGAGVAGGAGGQLGADIPYADVFNAAGNQYGIDPRLLAAISRVESINFSPDVISCSRLSPAGAKGIMQFMPDTAASPLVKVNDPCDPAQAIPGAARLVKYLHDRFGEWDLTLAAYNWGEGNVGQNGRSGWPAETTAYVPKVTGYWEEYKQKFPDGTVAAGGVFTGGIVTGGGAAVNTAVGPIAVVGGGIRLSAAVAPQAQAMLAAAAAEGVRLTGGGYRDPAGQLAVRRSNCGTSQYAIYEMPSSSCHPPTAKPGTSMHEKGLAIDFENCSSHSTRCYQWLAVNAARFGFINFKKEPWHWSTNGR